MSPYDRGTIDNPESRMLNAQIEKRNIEQPREPIHPGGKSSASNSESFDSAAHRAFMRSLG